MNEKIGIKIAAFVIAFMLGGTANNFAQLFYFLSNQESRQTVVLSESITEHAPDVELSEPEPEIIEEVSHAFDLEETFKIKLLTTGENFHGDQVEARNGEKWLGVFEKDGRIELRETRLRISKVFDELVDEPRSGQKTGKTVKASGPGKPLFLVRNARFQQGELPTVFLGKTWEDTLLPEFEDFPAEEVMTSFVPNTSQKFTMGGVRYELKAFSALNPDGKPIYVLALESGNQRQILHTIKMDANSDLGNLYWIGDLDGDGKPDLYLDLFEKYNVENKVLLLSSEAENGQMVKKVAYFWIQGLC